MWNSSSVVFYDYNNDPPVKIWFTDHRTLHHWTNNYLQFKTCKKWQERSLTKQKDVTLSNKTDGGGSSPISSLGTERWTHNIELMCYVICLFKYPAIPRSYSTKFCYEKCTVEWQFRIILKDHLHLNPSLTKLFCFVFFKVLVHWYLLQWHSTLASCRAKQCYAYKIWFGIYMHKRLLKQPPVFWEHADCTVCKKGTKYTEKFRFKASGEDTH